MITRLMWTIWTSLSAVRERPLNLNTHSLTLTGGFPLQSLVRWSFDVFFDLRLNKWLSKQSGPRWFETPSRSSWRPCNGQHSFKMKTELPWTEPLVYIILLKYDPASTLLSLSRAANDYMEVHTARDVLVWNLGPFRGIFFKDSIYHQKMIMINDKCIWRTCFRKVTRGYSQGFIAALWLNWMGQNT